MPPSQALGSWFSTPPRTAVHPPSCSHVRQQNLTKMVSLLKETQLLRVPLIFEGTKNMHPKVLEYLQSYFKQKQGGPENPKAKRHRANHFFLHVGNSTVSSSLRRNLDVFPVAVDQSLHWSSCASVDRLIPSKHPLVDHFMHMANGSFLTSFWHHSDTLAVFPSYFHGFIPSSIRSRSLPAQFPQAISTASSTSSIRSRSLPAKFSQAISTASSHRASGLAPSQRSFPKLFPRLHPVEHPVSLPPSAVFPSYFHGFIPSSIRSRSLPAQFSQPYRSG